MRLTRRHVPALLAGLGLALVGGPARAAAPEAAEWLARIEAYLNGIDTLSARFSQIAPDGGMAAGLLLLDRPGRMLLDYDPPSRVRLVAPGDWRLVFYDGSIKQVNVIPISQTPLGVLLDEKVTFGETVEVLDLATRGGEVAVTLARPEYRDQGQVALIFAKAPLELRRWTVIDAQGLQTHVLLDDLETGIELDPMRFRWRDPSVYGFPED